ncbi:MAG TPA: TonB-dependent receptor, partial [Steroidobacteraceae bacterium]|nr:TonB-dependent receptor [Steroidobacteraceae bacterium]
GDYRVTPDFLAYASVSTGFKGGGVNPRPFTADQRLPFNPETLTTYEVGFKSDLFDHRMRLNGAVFFNQYDDIILGKTVCPESVLQQPCLRPANIGAADVKGFELETTVHATEALFFDASVSVLDFKYTTDLNAQGNLVNTSIPGSGITPYTPEESYSIGAQFDHRTNAGTLSFRLDGAYQGDLFTNAENTSWGEIPGRMLANARIGWSDMEDKWKVALEVQNLTDKYYFLSKSDITGSLGLVTGVPGLPRTYQLSVERKF